MINIQWCTPGEGALGHPPHIAQPQKIKGTVSYAYATLFRIANHPTLIRHALTDMKIFSKTNAILPFKFSLDKQSGPYCRSVWSQTSKSHDNDPVMLFPCYTMKSDLLYTHKGKFANSRKL